MQTFFRNAAAAGFVGLALFSTAAARAPASVSAAVPLFEDPVVARGKGVEIKRSQVDDAFTAYRANLAARNQNLPEEQRRFREAQLLDRLITTQLLVNRATDA